MLIIANNLCKPIPLSFFPFCSEWIASSPRLTDLFFILLCHIYEITMYVTFIFYNTGEEFLINFYLKDFEIVFHQELTSAF